jgi:hypothetical protein
MLAGLLRMRVVAAGRDPRGLRLGMGIDERGDGPQCVTESRLGIDGGGRTRRSALVGVDGAQQVVTVRADSFRQRIISTTHCVQLAEGRGRFPAAKVTGQDESRQFGDNRWPACGNRHAERRLVSEGERNERRLRLGQIAVRVATDPAEPLPVIAAAALVSSLPNVLRPEVRAIDRREPHAVDDGQMVLGEEREYP